MKIALTLVAGMIAGSAATLALIAALAQPICAAAPF